MKNVLILHLSYSYNYGSMMMGESLISQFNKREKGIAFYACDKTPVGVLETLKEATRCERIFTDHKLEFKIRLRKIRGIRRVERIIKEKLLSRKIKKKYDAVIFLGGDDFAETSYDVGTNWGNKQVMNTLKEVAFFSGITKVFMLGQTIGPYTGSRLEYAKKVFNTVEIYTRDPVTAKYLRENDIKCNLSRDLALLPLERQNEYINNKFFLKSLGLNSGEYITIVGTGLFRHYGVKHKTMRETFSNIINYLRKKYPQKKIIYLSHVLGNQTSDYTLFSNKEYKKLFDSVFNEIMLPVKARMILGNSYFTITCRMHPSVSTFQMRKPAICLSYSVKYNGVVAESLGMHDLVVEAKGEENWQKNIYKAVCKKIDYIEDNYSKLIEKTDNNVSQSEKDLEKMFDEVVKKIWA